jgi:hypothetical protein
MIQEFYWRNYSFGSNYDGQKTLSIEHYCLSIWVKKYAKRQGIYHQEFEGGVGIEKV